MILIYIYIYIKHIIIFNIYICINDIWICLTLLVLVAFASFEISQVEPAKTSMVILKSRELWSFPSIVYHILSLSSYLCDAFRIDQYATNSMEFL